MEPERAPNTRKGQKNHTRKVLPLNLRENGRAATLLPDNRTAGLSRRQSPAPLHTLCQLHALLANPRMVSRAAAAQR